MPTTQFKLEYAVNPYQTPGVTVIVTAAGSSSRMGGIDKILTGLAGKPVLFHTLQAFENHPSVTAIIVVASERNLLQVQQICEGFSKITDVVQGGASRAESVAEGFARVETPLVLIHDGARPLVSKAVIDRVLSGLQNHAACAAAVPVRDTVKVVNEDGKVQKTLCREALRAMQTPQGFASSVYRNALDNGGKISAFTDDCALVENSGVTVQCVEGDPKNIKITTAEDLVVAAAFLKEE
ncbi:MAG: 2-C-methyl-D-erythritol 4-phosphate cytidylyltransferase [Clostridia bacterium]|nr:2-C-methyl-D-erythritol 4-phosphate cytidylyltransferase [Clostridia bacterium]